MIGRRGFITGLISFVAAPAIVRVGSLMPVKGERLLIGLDFGREAVAAVWSGRPVIQFRGYNELIIANSSFKALFDEELAR